MRDLTHEVSLPRPDYVVDPEIFAPPFPDNPSISFDFDLDPFQQTAIACIERGDSVMVSAHTSAGKTVLAEYAIALAFSRNQRVIYTSPIKALSNQKFRDFSQKFDDVGLLTGDLSLNPQAMCLVMTTEVLRLMLYRGSEAIREAAWIVFDEIHYLKDRERGVVWEESISLVPPTASMLFLSATLSNAKEFSDWIAHVHGKPCHVIVTHTRPVPLQHYVYPQGGSGLYLLMDEHGVFKEENFNKAMTAVPARHTDGDEPPPGKKPRLTKSGCSPLDVAKIVELLVSKEFDPAIIFSFSRKECEALAAYLGSKLDLNSEAEKQQVETVFNAAVDVLSDDDKQLPYITKALPLLQKGVACHHSGMLPILKEIVEILFQEHFIKILVATETFSMGLNMPAKTVVFTSIRKFDGMSRRLLKSAEYIQMSGRAGRRNLDARGVTIIMLEDKVDVQGIKDMVTGSAEALESSFKLRYSSLLHILRNPSLDALTLIRRSFHQFLAMRGLPKLAQEAQAVEKKLAEMPPTDSEAAEYYQARCTIEELANQLKQRIMRPDVCQGFLEPGRLVQVPNIGGTAVEPSQRWGVLLYVSNKGSAAENMFVGKDGSDWKVNVLVNCQPSQEPPTLLPLTEKGEPRPVQLPLSSLEAISALRIYVPKDLDNSDVRSSVVLSLREMQRRFPNGFALLDPIEDLHCHEDDPQVPVIIDRIERLEGVLFSLPFSRAPDQPERFRQHLQRVEMSQRLEELQRELVKADAAAFRQDLKNRVRILRRLGYVDEEERVLMKGHFAAEIFGADELVLTELVLSNSLPTDPAEVAALISCFIVPEKSKTKKGDSRSAAMGKALLGLRVAAGRVAEVCKDARLEMDVDAYVASFNTDLVDVVLAWAKGASFSHICKMTQVYEGSIVRTIRGIDEILSQLSIKRRAASRSAVMPCSNSGQPAVQHLCAVQNTVP